MSTVYDSDITITMRGVDDVVGLPFTVNPVELVDRDALIEIRKGPPGPQGQQGDPSWPWQWMGDTPDFATLQALGLGTGDARKAWRVVAEEAIYLWTGIDWIRFAEAFDTPGRQGAPNTLVGSGIAGPTGSSASAQILGTAPGQTLEITFPRGVTGDQGDPGQPGAISDAEDVGDLTGARQDSVLAWTEPPGEFRAIPAPGLIGPWAIASSQFNAGSNMSTSPKTLATMTIPAQPLAWRPIVMSGSVEMLTHVASANESRVDIEIRLGGIDGTLIGYGTGMALANRFQIPFYPRYEHPVTPTDPLGVLQANQTGSLYIIARRVTGGRNYTIVNAGAQLVIMGQPLREQPTA
ncbi:hypothetical protein [Nocardia cyriacigeorgica]|uniref:hypothetical protein n=1 Tax=Nocardia cyriacigeorgica TaxID=135487 RepID=UPI002456D1A9|nr:hypothetical protein [Nocardia cyriacigeorgica]